MIDFLMISTRSPKRGVVEVYPKFIIKKSVDLMIRGGDFYAVWVEDCGLWSTDEQDALTLIDRELDAFAEELRKTTESTVRVLHMWDSESGMIDNWHRYCQRQMRDLYHMLDEELIFSNTTTTKKNYASKRLNYPLEPGSCPNYDRLISTLYSEEERHKIEWAIGSIVTGDSKKIQKFIVLYGSAGTGKSTILNIIQQLFDGYYSVFDAKALGSSNNAFALEAFKSNPLVAIQHDGDLSRIEDNTRLNSLVSHEIMTVNEKFKSTYANRFKCFLFMGTNKPVKITDAKSGLIRRLIDVSPTGNKIEPEEYKTIVNSIKFELGAIAYYCRDVYLSDPDAYDAYIPVGMMGASNDFYNFMMDEYFIFSKEDGTTLKAAWEMYKTYCEDAKIAYPFPQRIFKEELKNYFDEYKDRHNLEDGTRIRSYYSGFKRDKFEEGTKPKKKPRKTKDDSLIDFCEGPSLLDEVCKNYFAQYANQNDTPTKKWENVTTKLFELDTSKVHYVKIPEENNHIVIDFDIQDEDGNKCLERNVTEASKWPPTYAELSKSGAGVHLHYIYNGDASKLSRVYDLNIEIKTFTGNSSLRRKLSKCNDIPIATISSGLPLKGEKMINFEGLKSERGLRLLIKRNLNKEIHPNTKPSIDFISKLLNDAYVNGMKYDVSDMRNAMLSFAAGSTNQADYCIKTVNAMKYKSDDPSKAVVNEEVELIFYDVEVFPNLFLVCYKVQGEGKPVVRMFNPTPTDIAELIKFRLVGFNCRRYDNHLLYACLLGYTNEQLYTLSQRIIKGGRNAFFGEAYNISYTDVYDFASEKKGLKKWEIELGIHHKELGLSWDEPVSEELWKQVAEYCDNDVIATEAVFNARKPDFIARQILAELAGLTVNDTTNTLTGRIIFGNDPKPQGQFNYRKLGDPDVEVNPFIFTKEGDFYSNFGDEYTVFDKHGRPIFPGYNFESGVSTYRGEEVGEGGYVYTEPGIYGNVALLDVVSMHPYSAVTENLFGDVYTQTFEDLLEARIAIKHKDFDKARGMLNGALAKYLDDESVAADLAFALKIAINSVYGLTAAGFDNKFRDIRNIDNIVAKRGALFMINLKHEVQKRGFIVAHIKTDSIKIPDATPEIIEFVFEYGKLYGYMFEHEAIYDRMCLVNKAVYIAKYATVDQCVKLYGEEYVYKNKDVLKDNKKKANTWTATGTQFQIPYVFKKLFSKEEIIFDDMCETKSVTSALYLDMNEDLPDVSEQEKTVAFAVKKAKEFGIAIDISKPTGDGELDPLLEEIAKGHNYRFIGKVGQFCPIKAGCGGGLLMREKDGKYYAATGSKGYRWLESEMVKALNKESSIDHLYYDQLVDDAVDAISAYGDFEWFTSEEPYVGPKTINNRPVYFDEPPIY